MGYTEKYRITGARYPPFASHFRLLIFGFAMDIFLVYLFDRFIYRVSQFIRHWYVDSFVAYAHFILAGLQHLDRSFALKVTARHLFEPLYQERNIIGYALGFIFRSGRLLVGGIVYAAIIALAFVVFLAWAAIPAFILLKIAGQTPAGKLFKVSL